MYIVPMKEIWKKAHGFDGYMVSNLGNVKSLKRKGVNVNLLTQFVNKGGYLFVYPYKNKKKYGVLAHRLVALTFIENPLNKKQVNHINGIKTDNRVENLEWCTAKENNKHARKNGLNVCKGGDKPKLNKEIAKKIREEHKYLNISELSRKYKVARTSIKKILLFQSYKTV